ncbi:MAG TPA: DNA polymerase IV [Baekduia sp.]|uniref:DNA polymerase IV n=1 Tax=Baekduia sp. TaxID=2600305 RepID=UPI002D792220|nr:DNA polymerase IV [Baekduia sp.]HET6506049.1 DNA polymerase IV [Baekduia sp.]
MPRASILHADLDAFFASVEQRDDPGLRGKPVIVGPGVVLAASYEARRFGVRSAMGGARARRLCPDAIVVPPRFSAYVEASKAVFAIFHDLAPTVEAISIDEAFLDVRGLETIGLGTPGEIAVRLRRRVRAEVGLPLSVGVASTKHLAKVASNAAKPDGLRIVAAGREAAFLHPLPVEALWGVGPATRTKLHAAGIRTVGQLAALDEVDAVDLLGRGAGRRLHAIAHNRDPRRVRSGRGRRSIGSQSALGPSRARSPAELEAIAAGLADRVCRRARRAERVGRTVVLRLRFGDYARATRSKTLSHPTAATEPVLHALRSLLAAEDDVIRRRGLTLLGLTLTNLERADATGTQLELPFDRGPSMALDSATDAIRDRFGTRALQRAALLKQGDRASAWLMPGEDPDGLPPPRPTARPSPPTRPATR